MKTRPTWLTVTNCALQLNSNKPVTEVSFFSITNRLKTIIFLLLTLMMSSYSADVFASKYYISPTGNDNNTGTITSPFFNLNKAWTKVLSGDTIYVRGGTYNYTVVQRIQNKSGTASSPIRVLAYPNEKPVFSFGLGNFTASTIAVATGWSSYIHVRGIRITKLPQVSDCNIGFMLASSSNNCTIENVEIDHIGGYGLTISSSCDNNLILNCDSHHNEDPISATPYDGSNGFGMTNNTTSDNNIFRGCRAWFNSDDGFDFFGSNTYVTLDNCWSFLNGYSPVNMSHTGNGSGFKLGPNTNGVITTQLRKLTNCLAYDNYLNGFDENFNSNGLNHFPSTLYNCTAFRNNGCGFYYQKFSDAHILKNNSAYLNGTNASVNAASVNQYNSWNGGVTLNGADFLTTDTTGMAGARQADGSLPVLNFLHLASTSDLINAGVNVGLPYTGTAPDMGVFESTGTSNQAPVILNQSFTLNENAANGTTVGTVVATDPNAGQTLTYSILSGNTNNAFSIVATTGIIKVATSTALNFEVTPSFALVVKVMDNGTGTLSSQATVTVALANVNEPPVVNNQSFSITQLSPNGTLVGTVVAIDPDAGQTKTFSITAGNTSTAFAINASSGAITIANSSIVNFATNPLFSLTVKVTDNGTGSLFDDAIISINVLQGTNLPPVIVNQTFTLNENTANGATVGTVVATDPNAGQALTYSILSGNTNNAFTIVATTGIIKVATSTALNFEVTPSFALVVKVMDNGTGTLSSQATVTVALTNVNEPPVVNNQSFSIIQLSPNGTLVGTVVATDPDAGQTKTFSITAGNTSTAFSINASSGVITVANSSILNYATNPLFSLTVKVTDNGTGSLFDDAIITINVLQGTNLPPVIVNQAFSLNENSVNGTTVGTVVATDPNSGQTLTYSIISGNTNSAFSIVATTGVIKVATSTALNYEATPSFALVVKVQDNGTSALSSQATVNISLNNVNEPPIVNNQAFSIVHLSPNGTLVGSVVATDPDAGQTKTYSITAGNTGTAFAISASTGVITVANSILVNSSSNPLYSLIVKVTDNGTGSLFDDAVITINVLPATNLPPVISNQTFSINENSPNGTTVGIVAASDPNAGQLLSYVILSGNTGGVFAINSTTGKLIVTNSSLLNYESIPSYSLTVKVTDNATAPLSATAIVTVNLININDKPVIGNQSFSVAEFAPNGSLVATVIATDPDAGQVLTYSITGGNTSNAFSINSTTGKLYVNNSSALNYSITHVFYLKVKARDNGAGNLSSTGTMTINVISSKSVPTISIVTTPLNTIIVGDTYSYDMVCLSSNEELVNYSIENLPEWLTFTDNQNGTASLAGTPGMEDIGNHQVLLKGYTSSGEVTQTFGIEVRNSTLSGELAQLSNSMHIFPNPVTDGTLKIKFDEPINESVELILLDMSGRALINRQYSDMSTISIDVSSFPPAIYLVKIKSLRFNSTEKFVKK